MSEPPVPDQLQQAIRELQARHLREILALMKQWPNFRGNIAMAEVGAAVGIADMMGEDVEAFLRWLRASEPKPTPIAPGPRSSS